MRVRKNDKTISVRESVAKGGPNMLKLRLLVILIALFWGEIGAQDYQKSPVLLENGLDLQRFEGLDFISKIPDQNTKSKCYSDTNQPQVLIHNEHLSMVLYIV